MTSGDTAVTYTYGADGLRLSKTVDGVTHHYVYSGGKLVEETFGNIEMQFIYDAQGYPMMVCLTRGSEQPLYYHYVVNLQGDVIRILKPNGAVCVTYQYDAWGNITRTGGPDTGLAQWNPLRYRGYVYDTETGLYYLQSRYYNPKVGRFINADGYVATGQGVLSGNMFAYCRNNPVILIDPSGHDGTVVLGAIINFVVGAAINTGISAIASFAVGEEMTGWDIAGSIIGGGAPALGPAGTVIGGIASGVFSGISSYSKDKSLLKAVVLGAVNCLATVATMGAISKAAGIGLEKGAEVFVDAVFGVASSLGISGLDKLIPGNSRDNIVCSIEKRPENLSPLAIIASQNQISSTRIVDGRVITIGRKNCSYLGNLFDPDDKLYCYVQF